MEARFAGSQRLGDRRRRRLAVETDDAPGLDTAGEELPAIDGIRRTAHPVTPETVREPITLPLDRLIPVQWWKYALGALSGLLAGGGILAAGWYEPLWAKFAGQGISRLFSLREAPVAAWYSGLLLNLSALLALLIWWGRSRSLKDFDGRYRFWTRTAGLWLLFSFCAVTGAHRAWSETVLHFAPPGVPQIDSLPWLMPAAIVGLGFLVALNRELSGCRASRTLLLIAATCYAVAAGLHLPLRIPIASRIRELTLLGTALLGHLSLFLSMWLHARHVLYCTPDPSRAARGRLRIPRPHFRLPMFGGGWRRSAATEGDVPAATEPRESKRRGRKAARIDGPSTELAENEAAAEPVPARTAPRIDAKPVERVVSIPRKPAPQPMESGDEEAAIEASRPEPADDVEPLTLPPRRETSASTLEAVSTSRPGQTGDTSHEEGDDDDAWTESFPKPDMRGMSKKQRRRLMQELREKERAQRRQSGRD